MSSTGPTARNYERRLARQRQLELMEAAASGREMDMMELDLSERSGLSESNNASFSSAASAGTSTSLLSQGGVGGAGTGTATAHQQVPMSPAMGQQRGGSIRSSALFERGDVYSSRPAVNLMDHTTGIYEAEQVGKRGPLSWASGLFKGKSSTTAAASSVGGGGAANYPYDADMNVEDLDELGALKQQRRYGSRSSRLSPIAAACQRCLRSRYCLVLTVLLSIGIITWVGVAIAQINASANTVDQVYVAAQKARYDTIVQSLMENGVLFDDTTGGSSSSTDGSGSGHVYNDTSLPQYHALRWVAFTDAARIDPKDPMLLQRYALATFFFGSYLKYSSVNGVQRLNESETFEDVPNPGWMRRDLWLSEKSHCLWFGVNCAAKDSPDDPFQPSSRYDVLGDVVGINLQDNYVMGTIPSEFGHLTKLEVLDLGTNKVSGTIPTQLCQIYTLEQVVLEGNQLTGEIPTAIGQLESLRFLHLGNNQFAGQLPTELGRLAMLRHLSIDHNKLTGTLPLLDNLVNLAQLWLDNNAIGGEIPIRWGLLKGLEELRLSQNKLTGSVPSDVATCKYLKTIQVDSNKLNGQLVDHMFIPLENSLEVFDIQHNELTGEVPESLGNMNKLTTLLLNNNKFSGPLPDAWVKLPKLKVWHMHDNDIEGFLPNFGVTPLLEEFWAHGNAVQGSIPASMGDATNLETVYLEHNDLTGTIPTELESLKKLQEIRLFDNGITGSMPSHVCALKKNNLVEVQIDCKEMSCAEGCCRCKDVA